MASRQAEGTIEAWAASPLGQAMLACERRICRGLADQIFGGRLLQFGRWPGSQRLLRQCRVNHCLVAAPEGPADVIAELDALPIASGSVEVVFMPHILAFCDNPHGVLREANRVLCHGGHLLILGFSPFSFWGLKALCKSAPFQGKGVLLAERRLGDWMQLLGLELLSLDRYLYRPPVSHAGLLRSSRWLERWGHARLPGPWPAGAYAALLQKRDLGGNLIRPVSRRRRVAALPVTHRSLFRRPEWRP